MARKELVKQFVQKATDEELHDYFRRGLLGNVAQGLGLSGRGTFDELLKAIRKEASK